MNIVKIIETVRADDHYGGGQWIEIAKGKNQLAATWRGMVRKLKRAIK